MAQEVSRLPLAGERPELIHVSFVVRMAVGQNSLQLLQLSPLSLLPSAFRIQSSMTLYCCRDSSVSIATRYGLDGPGIESRCPWRLWGPPSLLHNAYRLFLVGKAAGAWRWPPTVSGAEVKERVELYLYSPSVSSWPVLGWPLPLRLRHCIGEIISSLRKT